jgi:hypothetical protein
LWIPRFKFGPGFSEHDKHYIWGIIRHMMMIVASAGKLSRNQCREINKNNCNNSIM